MTGRVRDILHSDKATARQERLISAAYACSSRQIFIRKRKHSIIGLTVIVIDNTSAVHRSGRNSVCRRPTHHSQRDRGGHHPPRSCGPRYPADARTDCRTATPAGDCAMAGVRVARPRILGALLDAAAQGLQALPHVRLQWSPRMADFALWVAACETGCRPERH